MRRARRLEEGTGWMKTKKVVAIGAAGISAMVAVAAYAQMDWPKAETLIDAAGNLRVPDAYRTTYQSLGSWAVAADQGQGSKELHVVFASPGTITAYRNDGGFPDGAVLVKEVFEVDTGRMTTGTVSHAGTLKGWFVMVKASNGGRYVLATSCGVTAGAGRGSMLTILQRLRRPTTKRIAYPAMCRRELPTGFMLLATAAEAIVPMGARPHVRPVTGLT